MLAAMAANFAIKIRSVRVLFLFIAITASAIQYAERDIGEEKSDGNCAEHVGHESRLTPLFLQFRTLRH
jgi:hypothetical protein